MDVIVRQKEVFDAVLREVDNPQLRGVLDGSSSDYRNGVFFGIMWMGMALSQVDSYILPDKSEKASEHLSETES